MRLRIPLHPLANINLDTGFIEPPSAYHMTDKAYFTVLQHLARASRLSRTDSYTLEEVLAYYDSTSGRLSYENNDKIYQERVKDIAWLRSLKGSAATVPYAGFASGTIMETNVEPLLPLLKPDSGGCNPSTFVQLQQLSVDDQVR